MSADERQQAELLDSYWQSLKRPVAPSPSELEPEAAALTEALQRELSAPEPSTAFTMALRQRLRAEAQLTPSPNGSLPGHAQPADSPLLAGPAAGSPIGDLPRKPRWIVEIGKLAAAVVAVVLVGGLLIALFGSGDDTSDDGGNGLAAEPTERAGVAGIASTTSGEILIAMAPSDGLPHKLYIINTDGSPPRKLTPGAVDSQELEQSGVWSPDGNQIAFASRGIHGWQLWLINANGSDMRAIGPELREVGGIDWSPDGTRLLFALGENSQSALCVLPIDDPEAMRCESPLPLSTYSTPKWSPDGTRFAYVTVDNRRQTSINVANADFSDVQSLASGNGPQWSPDGDWIAFTQQVARINGGRSVQYTASIAPANSRGTTILTGDEYLAWNPRWSPNGNVLAYTQADLGGSGAGIVLDDRDGNVTKIADLVGRFEWKDDGHSLAVVTIRLDTNGQPIGSALYVVNIDGANERLLLETASLADTLAWRPSQHDAEPDQAHVEPTPFTPPTTPTVTAIETRPPPLAAPTQIPPAQMDGQLIMPLDLDGDGHHKLYLVSAEGEPVKVTSGDAGEPGSEMAPVWSHDGEQLLYTHWATSGELLLVNADGSNERNLSTGIDYVVDPQWSPDNARIAFVGHDGAYTNIYVMNADGSDSKALSRASANDFQPSWSPDGQQIAFVRAVFVPDDEPSGLTPHQGRQLARSIAIEGQTEYHLWIINADGSGERMITAASFDPQPRWSPDGREIAFTTGWPDEPQQAQIVDVESGVVRSVISGAVTSSQPRWSPDGAWLSAIVVDPGGSESAIIVVRPDGTEARTIGMGAGWWQDWSPDGEWIAVARTRLQTDGLTAWKSDLRMISVSTGDEIVLLDDVPIERTPAWRPIP